mgnify:CR=1 FL=1
MELFLNESVMRKSLVAIGAALLLLGAGCGGGGFKSSAPNAAYKAEVEAAFGAFIAAGTAADDVALQQYVAVPVDSVDAGGVDGYFTIITPSIDWTASTWSSDGTSVTLQSIDGVEVGIWKRDAEGNWKATSKFWSE